jgi:RNA polymerase sigma-70 factor, ECF subfamily
VALQHAGRTWSPRAGSAHAPVDHRQRSQNALKSPPGGGFGDACTRFLPDLHRYARSLTRDSISADDLIQETMLLALQKQHLFSHDANLRAWLFAIMHNCHVNNVRRGIRSGVHLDISEWTAVVSGDQEIKVEFQEVCRALDQVPEEKRTALIFAVYDQLSYNEISDVLKVPAGTVRSRIARARLLLRTLIAAGDKMAPPTVT